MSVHSLILAAALMALAMVVAWGVRMRTGQSGWIDAIWSSTVGAAGLVTAVGATGGGRRWLIAGLLVAWSGRLALHIAERTRGAADDPRYAELAREWGDAFGVRLFLFLQIQAVAGLVLAAVIHLAASSPAAFPAPIDVAATLVVLAGVFGEECADAQLRRFRRTASPGAVCDAGLWSWSRHPNYFFEWLVWCGFALFALPGSAERPVQLVAFTAPVMMWALLVHISGVPPLEAHMSRSRGEAFRAYCARVSPFFPRPPRRNPSRAAAPQEDTP